MGNTFVALFVHVTGFADSLESMSRQDQESIGSALWSDLSIHRKDPLEGPADSSLRSQFVARYRSFHHLLEEVTRAYHRATVVEFSDSAFVIMDDDDGTSIVQSLAIQLAFLAMAHDVPIRIGIGSGSFARIGFATVSQPSG